MAKPETGDDDLLDRLRAGDEAAFVALYGRWNGPLYRFALRMSGSRPTAEDVVQEVFMAVMSHVEAYDPGRGTLASYLYGIARNQVLRRLERDRGLVALDGAEAEGPTTASSDDPLAELVRQERVDLVWEAVLSLPSHYREVIVLCDLQALSYEDAAGALSCAVGTVRSRLHRGREVLGAKLRSAAARARALEPKRSAR